MTINKEGRMVLFASITLFLLGLVFIYYASYGTQYVVKQLLHFFIAGVLFGLIQKLDVIRTKRIVPHLAGIGFALMFAAMVFGVPGLERFWWLDFGYFRIQPGEFFKVALVLFTALLVTDNGSRLRRIIAGCLIVVGVNLVIFSQYGTAGNVIMLVMVSILFFCYDKKVLLVFVSALFIFGNIIMFTQSYKIQRFLEFYGSVIDREYINNQAYCNVDNIKKGHVVGLGFKQYIDYNVYNSKTSGILGVVAIRSGLLGVSSVVFLYAVFLWYSIKLVRSQCNSLFNFYCCAGLIGLLYVSYLLNMFTVMWGFPAAAYLPFLAYGHNPVITSTVALALIVSLAKRGSNLQLGDVTGKHISWLNKVVAVLYIATLIVLTRVVFLSLTGV
jgi:cell division protein FtsW (lipid II flippase)